MQLTGDELRSAVGGQWIVPPEMPHAPGRPPMPLVASGVATDTREPMRGALFVALRGERFDAHQFLAQAAAAGAVAALVDRKAGSYERPPGFPLLEVGDTRAALADLARTWRARLRGKVVAITGSSGKTTTRRLVHAALGTTMRGSASPKSYNNDIGVPLTILGADASHGYLVAEIGMSNPGEIAPLSRLAAPQVAIITMAGRAHLGGMGSVDAIIQEKSSLVDGLHTTGIALVNGDQPRLVAAVQARLKPGVRLVTFGTSPGCQWRLVGRQALGERQSVRIAEPDGTEWSCELGLPGDYNAMNALAAAACARLLGVDAARVGEAFAAVAPSEMRMVRQQLGDLALYNDAYNANPDAVQAALRAFAELGAGARRRVAVLGDMLELGEASAAAHAEVARAAVASGAGLLVFVGAESAHGAQEARVAAAAATAAPEILHIPALDDAGIARIAQALRPGDAILLKGSRGSRMERLVQALAARAADVAAPEGAAPCSTT